LKIGPKARLDGKTWTPEASPDDPVYTRGFSIGVMRLTDFLKNTPEKDSPKSKEPSKRKKSSGKEPDEFQLMLHRINEQMLAEDFSKPESTSQPPDEKN